MEKKILEDYLSDCCKKPIYVFKETSEKGLWCSCCDKEVWQTLNKEYYERFLKKTAS